MFKTAFLTLALLLTQQAQTKNATLQIDAALIYRNGDVKPVARVQFLILDASLAKILAEAKIAQPQDISLLTTDKELQLVITYGKAALNAPGHEGFLAKANEALKSHILASEMTGFDGKAELTNLPAKPCYVVAAARAGQSWIIWNLRAELKPGKNKILFDQNNAAFLKP